MHDFRNNIQLKFGCVHYRFVNDHDVVPRVPLRPFDYTHTGHLIHFDSQRRADSDSQEQRSFLARAFDTISAVVADFTWSPELIGDHDMLKGYLTCIRNGMNPDLLLRARGYLRTGNRPTPACSAWQWLAFQCTAPPMAARCD